MTTYSPLERGNYWRVLGCSFEGPVPNRFLGKNRTVFIPIFLLLMTLRKREKMHSFRLCAIFLHCILLPDRFLLAKRPHLVALQWQFGRLPRQSVGYMDQLIVKLISFNTIQTSHHSNRAHIYVENHVLSPVLNFFAFFFCSLKSIS